MIYTTTDPMSGRVSLKLQRSRSMLLTAISNSCWVTRQLQAVLCHKWLLLRRVRVASTDVGTWKGHTMQRNTQAGCLLPPSRKTLAFFLLLLTVA